MRARRRFSAVAAAALAGAALLAGGATQGQARTSSGHESPANALRSWEGVSDTAHAPAFAAGAVGTTTYVEMAGSKFGLYDRTHDVALSTGDLSQLLPDTPPAGHGGVLSEPQVLWDPAASRFYYSFLDLAPPPFAGDGTNYVAFGFSKDGSPAGPADFCRYELDFDDAYEHIDPLPIGDAFYPAALHMGDTPNNVLLGLDVYDWNLTPGTGPTNGYWGFDVDYVEKPAPGPISACPDSSFFEANSGENFGIKDPAGNAMRSPVPAVQVDSQFTDKTGTHALPGWVVASKAVGSGPAASLSAIRVTETGTGLPTLAPSVAIPVASYALPALAPQPGGSSLDTRDDAFLTQAVAAIDPSRGANVQAVWTQHTVAGGAGAQVRWYELNPAAKSVFQTGTVADPNLSVFDGAIAPDRLVNGATARFGSDMALAVTTSSASAAPAVQWVSKEGTGAQSGLSLLVQSPDPASGLGCENAVCAFGPAAASADPGADTSAGTGQVWLTSEWTSGAGDAGTANWRTQNAAIHVPVSAPVITSVVPSAAPVGAQVTINGSRFLGITSVQAGGVDMTGVTVTPTKITATVPAGATTGAVGQIAVTNDGGTATTPFRVTPRITGFAPSPSRIGDTVTVSGTNLDEVTAFTIGAVPATLATTSSTQGTFTVPPTAVTGKLMITTPAGSFTTPTSLVVGPMIGTPFVPTHAQTGLPVTIPGATFGGVTAVRFSGYAGGAPSVTAKFTFKAGVLTASVPAAAVSGPISVTTATGGTTVSADSFVVDPALTSLSAPSGPVDSTLTINGSGFDPTSVATFTSYDGTITAGAPLAGSTANALKVEVPEGASTGSVVVGTRASSVPATSGSFLVSPRISALSQSPVQPGDTNVHVSGFNFEPPVTLKVGAVAADVTQVDLNHVQFTVPDAAISAPLTVTAANGAYTTTDLLRVRPVLGGFTPPDAVAGAPVTITGKALTGTTGVKFTSFAGGQPSVPAIFTVTNGMLKATVPAAATTGPILVTNAGGSTATTDFVVDPKITSFAPASAPIGGLVTIAGTGFDANATAMFGGGVTAGPEAGTSATSLKLVVPSLATTGPITVQTAGSPHPTTTATSLKIGPRIDTFSSPVQIGDTVLVDGLNLDDAPVTVKLGSLAVTPINPSATHFEFVVPTTAATGKLTVTTGTGTFTTATNLLVQPGAVTASPASGAAGQPVTITGTGLNGVQSVSFTGPNATLAGAPFTTTGGVLKTTVPVAAVNGPIHVTTTGGSSATPSFTVLPKITSFTPASGAAGATVVTINGSGFQPDATVSVGGVAADAPTSVTPTQIRVRVAPGAATGTIAVQNPTDVTTAVSAAKFTVSLSVTAIAPEQAAVGDTVTITGAGFTSTSRVLFEGDGSSPGTVPATSMQFVSATHQLRAVVPACGGGRVTVENGTSAIAWSRDDLSLLAITSIGPASQGPTGLPVTLTGRGFAAADIVTFNGHAVPSFTAGGDGTTIEFTIPDGDFDTNGPTAIAVSAPNCTTPPATIGYTVDLGISDFAPASGPIGGPLTIDGAFPTGDVITGTLSGTALANLTVHGGGRLIANVPFGATSGKIAITDTTRGETVTSKSTYTVTLVLSPFSGPTGTVVTATGLDFANIDHVTIDGNSVPAAPNTPGTNLTFTIPDGTAAGSHNVTIQPVTEQGDPLGSAAVSPFVVTSPVPYAGPH